MRLTQVILSNKKYTVILSAIFVILTVLFILQVFILDFDLFFEIKSFITYVYFYLLETVANPVLSVIGSPGHFLDEVLYAKGVFVREYYPGIRYEVLTILLVILVWITKAPLIRKIIFTGLLLIAHFLSNSLYLVIESHLVASGVDNVILMALADTFGLLIIMSMFLIWYMKHKDLILSRLTRFKINIALLKNDFLVILSVCGVIIISSFLIEIFEFKIWIRFLFVSSREILDWFGYDAVIENLNLVGSNGKIMMSKACLGFQLMLLFTIMILLTGNNRKARWKYVTAGILFLNFINILRFVFLFIHLEKHGSYELAMEAHNLYNLITYVVVFLLWVLWFEIYADRKVTATASGKITSDQEK